MKNTRSVSPLPAGVLCSVGSESSPQDEYNNVIRTVEEMETGLCKDVGTSDSIFAVQPSKVLFHQFTATSLGPGEVLSPGWADSSHPCSLPLLPVQFGCSGLVVRRCCGQGSPQKYVALCQNSVSPFPIWQVYDIYIWIVMFCSVSYWNWKLSGHDRDCVCKDTTWQMVLWLDRTPNRSWM